VQHSFPPSSFVGFAFFPFFLAMKYNPKAPLSASRNQRETATETLTNKKICTAQLIYFSFIALLVALKSALFGSEDMLLRRLPVLIKRRFFWWK
jgi:hypothetical protein